MHMQTLRLFVELKTDIYFTWIHSSISDNRPQKIIGGIFQWVMGNNWNMYS